MGRHAQILRFGDFELDCENRQLRQNGTPVELGSRYFDALALLVARPGELVSKDSFMDEVWQGIPVTDEALTQCIRTLRRALGDNAANPRFIQTVPKHGYRFIGAMPRQAGAAPRALASRIAGACTLSGLAAGAAAGFFYGMVAGIGGGGQVLILSAMIGVLGLLAGAGLGAGMAATLVWRQHVEWWIVAGTALGGLAIGALGNLLGREGVGLLSGVSDLYVTGPFEGAILGSAAGLAAWAALAGKARRIVLATALCAGGVAGLMIFLSGGILLAGSLHALELGVSGMQLDVDRIGSLLGEQGLTRTAQGFTSVIEAQVFVLAIAWGLLLAGRISEELDAPRGFEPR